MSVNFVTKKSRESNIYVQLMQQYRNTHVTWSNICVECACKTGQYFSHTYTTKTIQNHTTHITWMKFPRNWPPPLAMEASPWMSHIRRPPICHDIGQTKLDRVLPFHQNQIQRPKSHTWLSSRARSFLHEHPWWNNTNKVGNPSRRHLSLIPEKLSTPSMVTAAGVHGRACGACQWRAAMVVALTRLCVRRD